MYGTKEEVELTERPVLFANPALPPFHILSRFGSGKSLCVLSLIANIKLAELSPQKYYSDFENRGTAFYYILLNYE